jgi:hypothetical protein
MEEFSSTLVTHKRLQTRFAHSKEFLHDVRVGLGDLPTGSSKDVCIFAGGSLGRFETGRKSDLDVFFLARPVAGNRPVGRLQEIQLFADVIRLNERLSLPPFSGDGRFLRVHRLDDLVNSTGDSSRDDSENLFTTRLLLLLESKPISNDTLYHSAVSTVVDNYFRDGKGRHNFQPLFLLNDILRYWRTLCLNYERDRTLQKPWWKKNLNLKFCRKLTVFSTVLAIVSEMVSTTEQFIKFSQLVPLQRLAATLDHIAEESLREKFAYLLDDYEEFLAAKSYAELEQKNPEKIEEFREKAQTFGDFFYDVLESKRLKRGLVRYVLV